MLLIFNFCRNNSLVQLQFFIKLKLFTRVDKYFLFNVYQELRFPNDEFWGIFMSETIICTKVFIIFGVGYINIL